MKNLILLIVIALLFSCKAKQVTVEKVITKIDTVKITETVKVEVPIEKVVTIEQPCDSLGNLKPIDKEIITKYVKVYIKEKDGSLVVQTNIDSIVESKILTEKTKWESENITKQLPPEKYIPNWVKWLAYIGGGFVLILTGKLLKKYTTILNFLPF